MWQSSLAESAARRPLRRKTPPATVVCEHSTRRAPALPFRSTMPPMTTLCSAWCAEMPCPSFHSILLATIMLSFGPRRLGRRRMGFAGARSDVAAQLVVQRGDHQVLRLKPGALAVGYVVESLCRCGQFVRQTRKLASRRAGQLGGGASRKGLEWPSSSSRRATARSR